MDPNERNKLIGVIDSGTNTTRFVVSQSMSNTEDDKSRHGHLLSNKSSIIRVITMTFPHSSQRSLKHLNWRNSARTLWKSIRSARKKDGWSRTQRNYLWPFNSASMKRALTWTTWAIKCRTLPPWE